MSATPQDQRPNRETSRQARQQASHRALASLPTLLYALRLDALTAENFEQGFIEAHRVIADTVGAHVPEGAPLPDGVGQFARRPAEPLADIRRIGGVDLIENDQRAAWKAALP